MLTVTTNNTYYRPNPNINVNHITTNNTYYRPNPNINVNRNYK